MNAVVMSPWNCRDTHLNRMWLFWYHISVIFFWLTFEIGVVKKESSANLLFVEFGRRGNVRAEGDLKKRRIYDLSELFCAPQVWLGFDIKKTPGSLRPEV